ncbi:tRNA (guanine(9)-N1)-methyltransferase [Paramyrothecium foliicola]|nr:tRNA (guanine(9)-N1)-methyltransferase [Paramyrothecium foliicola]
MSSTPPAELTSDVAKPPIQDPAGEKPAESEQHVTSDKTASQDAPAGPSVLADGQPPMSKNALKRLRRQQEWEDSKDDRRKRRKEKRHAAKGRKREEREALLSQGVDLAVVFPQRPAPTPVPVALVLDCDFESYMTDKERISLCSQVTRSYSDNRQSRYRASLWIAGWRGKITERFHGALRDTHKGWRGVQFVEGDFLEAAVGARQAMKDKEGKMIEPLQRSLDERKPMARDPTDPFPLPDPAPELAEEYKDVVYLTSDSPYTLERIAPHTTYVIGGLVDKNREKGLCYRRARERGIRTAKLPIGQFMVMQSRQVLATNHVVEIMLRWLECEDWGKAFLKVIPKRKGGKLRGEEEEEEEGGGADGKEGQDAAAEEDDEVNEEDEQEEALEALAEANALDEERERADKPAEAAERQAPAQDQPNSAKETL